jgi:hypothetical protein
MWTFIFGGASGANLSQNTSSLISNAGTTDLKLAVTTANTSPASTDYLACTQKMEGYSLRPASFGTSNAKPMTLSFRAVCNLSNFVMCVSFRNNDNNRSYVTTVTLNPGVADYSISIPGDTAGTWLNDNRIGIRVVFSVLGGASYQTTTLNAWQSGNFFSHSSGGNLMSSAGNFVQLADVQFEIGSVRTSYQARFYADEFLLCRRYYQVMTAWVGSVSARTSIPVNMRASPILVAGGSTGFLYPSTTADTFIFYQTTPAIQTLIIQADL